MRKVKLPFDSAGLPEKRLPFNKRVGPMKVGPNAPKIVDGKLLYYAVCKCGQTGWYEEGQLRDILELKTGCGGERCTAVSFRHAVWRTEESLRLQLFTFLLIGSKHVSSFYGGTHDDMYKLDFEEAYENLEEELKLQGESSGPWLSRKADDLPFMEGNVQVGYEPDPLLRRANRCFILVDGSPIRLDEVGELSGLSTQTLLMRIYKLGGTDDLLYKLMEESRDGN